MICIGKKEPGNEITKVKVIFLLSVRPFYGHRRRIARGHCHSSNWNIRARGLISVNYQFRENLMLCDGSVDICEISKLAFLKNPRWYRREGSGSCSAWEIAPLINRPNPGCRSLKSWQICRWININQWQSRSFYHREINYAPWASYTLKEGN